MAVKYTLFKGVTLNNASDCQTNGLLTLILACWSDSACVTWVQSH